MTPEQLVAILGAITALVVAVGAVFREIHQLKVHINSRMDQLIDLTATSSRAEGMLAEQRRVGDIPTKDKYPA